MNCKLLTVDEDDVYIASDNGINNQSLLLGFENQLLKNDSFSENNDFFDRDNSLFNKAE